MKTPLHELAIPKTTKTKYSFATVNLDDVYRIDLQRTQEEITRLTEQLRQFDLETRRYTISEQVRQFELESQRLRDIPWNRYEPNSTPTTRRNR